MAVPVGNRLGASRGNTLVANAPNGAMGAGSDLPAQTAPTFVGPGGGGGGLVNTATFEEGTAGAALSLVNGLISTAGSPVYSAAAAVHGALGVSLSGGSAQAITFSVPSDSFMVSLYAKITAASSTNTIIMQARDAAGGIVSRVRYDSTTGLIRLMQSTTADRLSFATAVPVGTAFRLDVKWNLSDPAFTRPRADLYIGANIDGTVPDETQSTTTAVFPGPIATFDITPQASETIQVDTIRFWGGVDTPMPLPPFAVPVALSGSGSLAVPTATPAASEVPALTGDGSLAVAPIVGFSSAPALSGGGSLAAGGTPSPAVTPGLGGSGSLAVTTRTPAVSGAPALGGSGSLGTSATVAVSGTPALGGSGTLAVTARTPAVSGTPALGGSGTLAVTARTPAFSVNPALSGSGALNATAGGGGSGAPALSGSGSLGDSGTPAVSGVGPLSGSGSLGVNIVIGVASSRGFSGAGSLAALTQMAISVALGFLGDGTLTASRVSTGIVRALLAAQKPDDDPGAVAATRPLGARAWVNRRHIRHGVDAWLGPISAPADVVLNLAVAPDATVPGALAWTAPTYVAGRPGYLFDTPATPGRYRLWVRDGITGDPSAFATITVT